MPIKVDRLYPIESKFDQSQELSNLPDRLKKIGTSSSKPSNIKELPFIS
ncbi:MAG: hypothetical protein AB199_01455 [Parcubacteria bacterium C7867-004]|nr:MAG: hypothetical protein AB199_01455 [Parcubacteria bacterium C7867-004]